MNVRTRPLVGAAMILALASSASAQVLHTNNRWDECAIVLDASLTPDAWRQFIGEVANVAYFRPLTSAKPLGARRFEVAVLQWSTKIDDAEDAWNDTFSHPDSTHWLFDGDALPIPGLMVRAGVTDRVDVGAYFTQNPNANYGFVGAQVQYSLLHDAPLGLAAAGRASVVRLFGPEDLTASVYGLDFLVSRDVYVFSPYVGVSGSLSRGRERTSKVDLEDENVLGVQGTVGVAASVWALKLGAEYSVGRVDAYAFKIAFGT